jgi:hypothetical protein
VDFDLGTAPSTTLEKLDLAEWLDTSRGIVRSRTGELEWNFEQGVLTVSASSVQGAVGFLGKQGTIVLPDLIIRLKNESAAVLAVALDGAPLAQSSTVLIQVATEATNAGWQAPGLGLRTVVSAGGPPIWREDAKGWVALRSPLVEETTVVALDANGYQAAQGTGQRIQLRPDAPFYVVRRARVAAP